MEEQDLIWLINNIWERENASGKRGIEGPKTGFWNGRYHAYEATNGIDVGPGFDLKFQSDEFKRKAETVGFTKKELDDILRQRIQKELPYIRQRVEKEGGTPNTLTKEIIGGLFDIYHTRQNGLYSEFPKLWKAIAIGDYQAMQRESRTTYKDKRGNKHVDEERWNYRKQMYFC